MYYKIEHCEVENVHSKNILYSTPAPLFYRKRCEIFLLLEQIFTFICHVLHSLSVLITMS